MESLAALAIIVFWVPIIIGIAVIIAVRKK